MLPNAVALETAKTYREKKAKPLLARIVKVLRSVYNAYLDLSNKVERLQFSYNREVNKNNTLFNRLEGVLSENKVLRNVAENYERVSRAYGLEQVAATVEAVKRQEQAERAQKRVVRQRRDRVSRRSVLSRENVNFPMGAFKTNSSTVWAIPIKKYSYFFR